MAIALKFIDLVVRISVIRAKYPGGWDQCLEDHSHLLGGRVWHDEHLFHDGTMNPMDMQDLVAQWAERGFEVDSPPRDKQVALRHPYQHKERDHARTLHIPHIE